MKNHIRTNSFPFNYFINLKFVIAVFFTVIMAMSSIAKAYIEFEIVSKNRMNILFDYIPDPERLVQEAAELDGEDLDEVTTESLEEEDKETLRNIISTLREHPDINELYIHYEAKDADLSYFFPTYAVATIKKILTTNQHVANLIFDNIFMEVQTQKL